MDKSLWQAAYSGNEQQVKSLLTTSGSDVNYNLGGATSSTPLNIAVLQGHSDIVQLLLDAKADVNLGDSDGLNPLHRAAHEGRTNLIALLVKYGAKVNTPSNNGKTALHYGVLSDTPDTVRELLIQGADRNKVTGDGKTARDMLLEQDKYYQHALEILKLLE